MSQDDKTHTIQLLKKLRERRSILDIQRATAGYSTDPSIQMEIDDLNNEITMLEKQIDDTSTYALTTLPLPLQKYDVFLKNLFSHLPSKEEDLHKFRNGILHALGTAFSADHSFIARDTGIGWDIVASYSKNRNNSNHDRFLDNDLQGFLHRSIRHQEDSSRSDPHKFTGIIIGTHPHDSKGVIVAPLIDITPIEVLVILGTRTEFEFDTALASMLDTLINSTKNLTIPQNSITMQMNLLNTLKRNYVYVSDWMYEQQFKLFQNKLKSILMFFEPILSLSHYPYICRWEALARDPATLSAPRDLFETAELWGRAFQLELDMHCLLTAVESYRNLPIRPAPQSKSTNEGNNRSYTSSNRQSQTTYKVRVGDILPLSVNVYPETLVRRVYRETIISLAKKRIVPLDKITLEISEKVPLPVPEDALPGQDEVSWFRERLKFYTKLGISIAIDDYGVGFASASRLSRLEPAVVKIDRDALLHVQGSYTIQHVLKLEQDSMGKLQVIVEGFDDESKISLSELNQLGIRYVQGHAVGLPIPATGIYRLTPEQEDDFAKKAGLL